MRAEPNDDLLTLVRRLKAVSEVLYALGLEGGEEVSKEGVLLLLADVTNGLVDGVMGRLQTGRPA